MVENTTSTFSLSSAAMTLTKQGVGLGGAGLMALGLLFLMTQLINNELPPIGQERSIVIPSFTPVIEDIEPAVIKIIKPTVEVRPEIQREDFTYDNPVDDTGLTLDIPEAKAELGDLVTGSSLPAGMPLVPISVIYPEAAARRGLCGHATVRYDIGTDGVPVNVAVVESSHRVFNKNAIRAISKARYKPDSVGGKAVMIQNKHERIIFRLEEGC